jgi:ferric-dicitrate binding protein FerR (iron transport regulator)
LLVATLQSTTGAVTTETSTTSLAAVAPGASLRVDDIVATGDTSRATVMLTAGPELRLDVATRVRFAANNRLELIQGAVFVDTKARSAAPSAAVVVSTRLGDAHDVGTRFEVRLLTGAVRVRVRQGMVRLVRGGATNTAPEGTELLATESGSVSRANVDTSDPEWTWVTLAAPPFPIEGIELGAFIAWLEREGGRPVRFSSDQLRRRSQPIVLHGSIAGLTLQQALAVVLPSCGLTHRIVRGSVIIDAADEPGRAQ